MANFYTLAFIGLLIQWMKIKMKEKPEVIMEKLSELVEGNFETALHEEAVTTEIVVTAFFNSSVEVKKKPYTFQVM